MHATTASAQVLKPSKRPLPPADSGPCLQRSLPHSAARQPGRICLPSCPQSGPLSPGGRLVPHQPTPPLPPSLSQSPHSPQSGRMLPDSLPPHHSLLRTLLCSSPLRHSLPSSSRMLPDSPLPPCSLPEALLGSRHPRHSLIPADRLPHSRAHESLVPCPLRSLMCQGERGAGRAQASWRAQPQQGRPWTATSPNEPGPASQLEISRWFSPQVTQCKPDSCSGHYARGLHAPCLQWPGTGVRRAAAGRYPSTLLQASVSVAATTLAGMSRLSCSAAMVVLTAQRCGSLCVTARGSRPDMLQSQGSARKRRSPSQPVDEGFREKRQAVSSDEAPGQAQQHDKAPSKPSYSRLRPDG